MKKTLLALSFLFIGLAAHAQLAYSGGDSSRNSRSAETSILQVFPNPAADYFSITSQQNIDHITVYNLLGRQLKTFAYAEGERYFIGDLPKGMYLVQIMGRDNRLLSTQRLSKR